jgi:hypothetical protein
MSADRATDRLRRNPAVLWRRIASGVVLLTPDAEDAIEVTGSGARLWELLAEPISVSEIAAQLAEEHRTEKAIVQRDLAPVLDALTSQGAIEVVR